MKFRTGLAAILACAMGAGAMSQSNTPSVKPSAAKPVAPTKQAAAPTAQPAADKKPADSGAPAQPDSEADMAAWMATAAPGEHHKHMEKMAGEWACTVKSGWGGKMEESKGTVKNAMRMGGRYMVSNFQGEMMGQAMVGQGVMGFNNITQKYETTWRDNMSTGMMMEFGTCDAAGKVITTTGESAAPGGQTMKTRTVYTLGDGKYTVEAFVVEADGKDSKVFEMTCVRTKAPGKGAAAGDDEEDAVERVKKNVRDAAKPK